MRPEAIEALTGWARRQANPASTHAEGRAAAAAVARARDAVAHAVGASPRQVWFVASATEAHHTVLRAGDGPVAFSALEHPSVGGAVEASGRPAIAWPVGADGRVRPPPAGASLYACTAVPSETGIVQPAVDTPAGAWRHVDAVQAFATQPVSMARADSVVIASGKIGGPVGVAALILADGRSLAPLFPGSAERGRRGGTVSVALVAAFGAAVEATVRDRDALAARAAAWQRRLDHAVRTAGGRVVGGEVARVPTHTLGVFPGLPGEAIVAGLDLAGVAASVGAACASGSQAPSPALVAMGEPDPLGAVRLSTCWATTEAEVAWAVEVLPRVVSTVRAALDPAAQEA